MMGLQIQQTARAAIGTKTETRGRTEPWHVHRDDDSGSISGKEHQMTAMWTLLTTDWSFNRCCWRQSDRWQSQHIKRDESREDAEGHTVVVPESRIA